MVSVRYSGPVLPRLVSEVDLARHSDVQLFPAAD